MTEVIFVPVKYGGKELKAPFLLFTGWTIEQRRQYAKDLRAVKAEWSAKKGGLCSAAGRLAMAGRIRPSSEETLSETLSHALQQERTVSLPFWAARKLEYSLEPYAVTKEQAEICRNFRGIWLDLQIGMVDVPEFKHDF